jgi:hypothetical protein
MKLYITEMSLTSDIGYVTKVHAHDSHNWIANKHLLLTAASLYHTLNGRSRYLVKICCAVWPVSIGEIISLLPAARSLLVFQSSKIGALVSGRKSNVATTTTDWKIDNPQKIQRHLLSDTFKHMLPIVRTNKSPSIINNISKWK